MVKRICFRPRSGFQSFFNVFTHISPSRETLGWNILVVKKALGGETGKSLDKLHLTWKHPPKYGVPAGHGHIS